MKKVYMVIVCLAGIWAIPSYAINPSIYEVGMEYNVIKELIFEDENFVTAFDENSIDAISTESGTINVKFIEGKAVEINIFGVADYVLEKQTALLMNLQDKNATLVSARPSNDPSSVPGVLYLWKEGIANIEIGILGDSETGDSALYVIMEAVTAE